MAAYRGESRGVLLTLDDFPTVAREKVDQFLEEVREQICHAAN
jgi:CTP:molybdopterin cytidylyltransferase MocA